MNTFRRIVKVLFGLLLGYVVLFVLSVALFYLIFVVCYDPGHLTDLLAGRPSHHLASLRVTTSDGTRKFTSAFSSAHSMSYLEERFKSAVDYGYSGGFTSVNARPRMVNRLVRPGCLICRHPL